MELIIKTTGEGSLSMSGRILPARPRDLPLFRPEPYPGWDFGALQEALARAEARHLASTSTRPASKKASPERVPSPANTRGAMPGRKKGTQVAAQPAQSRAGRGSLIHCESPGCRETRPSAAGGKGGIQGSWYCDSCAQEAQAAGVKLFECVLETRRPVGPAGEAEYLVKYFGLGAGDAEWVPHGRLQELEFGVTGL